MTELVTHAAAVRYCGTVDKFTGDGIMALFGACADAVGGGAKRVMASASATAAGAHCR